MFTQTGTPYYACPEVWLDQPYDFRSDIWSIGCVLYEMCSLAPPFKGKDVRELCSKVVKGHYENIPTRYSDSLTKVIAKCLQVTPLQRPTIDQLLACDEVRQWTRDQPQDGLWNTPRVNLLETIRCP